MKPSPAALALLALPLASLAQPNPDTDLAYGANVGWVNIQPQRGNHIYVDAGEHFFSGYIYGANIGWISLGNGMPKNGHSYSNTTGDDSGINNDGAGNLSGLAYGANIGWINFGWAGLNDPNRPRFDLDDGEFHGFAYSANCGWVNLGTGRLFVTAINRVDSDHDGIDDAWEMQWFGNLTTAGIGTDHDGDGQSDSAEYVADTDPLRANDYLKVVSHAYANGQTTVAIVFTSQPSRRYQLQHSTDLVKWDDSGLGEFNPDAGTTTTKGFSFTGNARHFFRVVAVLPLPQP